MCGILWLDNKNGNNATKPLLKRYNKQSGRGTDGFGYVSVGRDGKVLNVGRAIDEDGIVALLRKEEAPCLLLHHRAPTSLPNYVGATHPFLVQHNDYQYDYYVVHNGVISNWKFLYDSYKKEGIKFTSEMKTVERHEFTQTGESYDVKEEQKINDSEAFAVDITRYIEGKQALIRSSGSIAFIALQCTKDGKVVNVIWGRNHGSPIKLESDKSIFCLNSDSGGDPQETGKLYYKNWETGKITKGKAEGLSYEAFGYKKNRTVTPDDDDGVEDTLKKLAPARNVPVRTYDLPAKNHEKDVERHLTEFVARTTGGISGGKNLSLPIINYSDDVRIEDYGYSEELLELHIKAAEATGDSDSEIIKELRDDLYKQIDTENDALSELSSAKTLLRSAAQMKPFDRVESETAKALVDIAESELKIARKQRWATLAELEQHVPPDHSITT